MDKANPNFRRNSMKSLVKSVWVKFGGAMTVAALLFSLAAFVCPTAYIAAAPDLTSMRAGTVWVLAGMENSVSTGSGFLVGNGDYVVTNWHVVESVQRGAKIFVVAGKNNSIPGTIAGYSSNKDLAIIKLEKNSGRKPVLIERQEKVQVGEGIFVIGFPAGPVSAEQMSNIMAIDETVTRGIVSKKIHLDDGVNYYQT